MQAIGNPFFNSFTGLQTQMFMYGALYVLLFSGASTQGRHALIVLRGHEWGGGGGGVVMWHTAATVSLVYLFVFLFIRNIPKRSYYIKISWFSHL